MIRRADIAWTGAVNARGMSSSLDAMPRVLVVADAQWTISSVRSALSAPGYELSEETDPRLVSGRVSSESPDVAVVDLQVGSMGGMAIIRELKDDASIAGLPHVPVVLLLDRRADAFLAKRAGAEAWVQKPFTAFELRKAVESTITVEAESE